MKSRSTRRQRWSVAADTSGKHGGCREASATIEKRAIRKCVPDGLGLCYIHMAVIAPRLALGYSSTIRLLRAACPKEIQRASPHDRKPMHGSS